MRCKNAQQISALIFCSFFLACGLLITPGKVSAYKQEFSSISTLSTKKDGQPADIDVSHVIEAVRHHIAPSKIRSSVFQAESRLYKVEFMPEGFSLKLRKKSVRSQPEETIKSHRQNNPLGPTVEEDYGPCGEQKSANPSILHSELMDYEELPAFQISVSEVQTSSAKTTPPKTPWRSHYNQAYRQVFLGLTERVTAREGFLEWDFILDQPLQDGGSLCIVADISAEGAAAKVRIQDRTLSNALRWPVGKGRSIRMGEMVVKDAFGREVYRALPEISSLQLRLEVPEKVLSCATYPVTIDPDLSPEYPASEPVYQSWAPEDQVAADVAASPWPQTNPSIALVVWEDYRYGKLDIYGARVNGAGELLDPAGILISTAIGDQKSPAVDCRPISVPGQYEFLVVWEDYRAGTDSNIHAARVRTDGTLLDGPPETGSIPICTAAGDQVLPSLDSTFQSGWVSPQSLVVWEDRTAGSAIYGARLRAGSLLDGPPDTGGILIASGAMEPQVSCNGSSGDYFVVYGLTSSNSIKGSFVSTDGEVAFPPKLLSSSTPSKNNIEIAFGAGGRYLIVWDENSDLVRGLVMAQDGSLVTGAIVIADQTVGYHHINPDVASNGTDFLVVWQSQSSRSDILASRMTADGVILDPFSSRDHITISASASSYDPVVTCIGLSWLVAWEQHQTIETAHNIHGARVDSFGNLVDTDSLKISVAANDQLRPAVAFDGTNFLVVWDEESTIPNTDVIYAARVAQNGNLLDGQGIEIATGSDLRNPAVAWGGTNYLIAWEVGSPDYDIYGARLSPTGAVLDPAGIGISTEGQYPKIAWNSSNYLVIWEHSFNIYGARISAAGNLLDGNALSIGSGGYPALAPDGVNSLVAYVSGGDIRGTRVTPTGTVLDIGGFPISTATGEQGAPAVAWNGENYLVVWPDGRNGGSDIYASRVSSAGVALDPAGRAVATSYLSEYRPAVARDENRWLVIWEEYRLLSGIWPGYDYDIKGRLVSPTGSGLTTFDIAASDMPEKYSCMGGITYIAVGYERLATEPEYGGNQRVFLTFYGTPCGPEVCDGKDNDCDGDIDEGLSFDEDNDGHYAIGSCTGPADDCDDNDNEVYPGAPELCDGKDNDCDGTEDDFTRTTHCGVGQCAGNIGEQTCTAGSWSADTCDPFAGSTPEECDNQDNDCDGATDEELTRPTTCGLGECSGNTGEEVCSAGSWVNDTCDPFAGATSEICDGNDNDCDGAVDEDNPGGGKVCGSDVGQCETGLTSCVGGEIICQDEIGPSSEICDYLDNNCDGFADEDFDAGQACSVGLGACQAFGTMVCSADGSHTVCDAVPGTPSTEICDGIDNDCDGDVDEGVQTHYYGDADGDSWGNGWDSCGLGCSAPQGCVDNKIDCDDTDDSIGPCNTPPDPDPVVVEHVKDQKNEVAITFPSVIDGGETTIQEVSCELDVPVGYTLNLDDICYNIETGAIPGGLIEVCITFDMNSVSNITGVVILRCSESSPCEPLLIDPSLSTNSETGTATICAFTAQLSTFSIAVEPDSDFDGWGDSRDNCPGTFNPSQKDSDNDGVGDACDNCPDLWDPTNECRCVWNFDLDQDVDGKDLAIFASGNGILYTLEDLEAFALAFGKADCPSGQPD